MRGRAGAFWPAAVFMRRFTNACEPIGEPFHDLEAHRISKAIIEKLGGKSGFSTGANRGSTFYFDLPEWKD